MIQQMSSSGEKTGKTGLIRQIRVLVVIGTRPETIKMIPVIRALQQSGVFRPVVIATGQHTDMVESLIAQAGLRLDAMLHAGRREDGRPPSLNELVARVMTGIDRIWREQRVPEAFSADGRRTPEGAAACLVHGDTSSAMAAALAAFNLQIPIVHVEAGLRTSNLSEPFPEEGNRQIISRLASVHFAPTEANRDNLLREGVEAERIVVTGNTSIDMLGWAAERPADFGPGLEVLTAGRGRRLVLVTAHRRENWGAGLRGIASAIELLSERYPDVDFVVPMHPNPVARGPLVEALDGRDNVLLVEPRDYFAFVQLTTAASLIITDSGGVQEEAPAFGIPVLVTRGVTEREEGVRAGTLQLVGTDPERIVAAASVVLDRSPEEAARAKREAPENPYGDGRAAIRIVESLRLLLCEGPAPAELEVELPGLRDAVQEHLGRSAAESVPAVAVVDPAAVAAQR
mgnify:CR=1 FL=1